MAVSVQGLPAPVYATLINISETGCRVRSLILIDRSRWVEFELSRPGREPLRLRGKVVSRATPQGGAGFEYGVSFDALSGAERDALVREITELQRREAAARTHTPTQEMTPQQRAKQRRRSVRTMAVFPIRYRQVNRGATFAEACDISTGGLRLFCKDLLPIGTPLDLRFTLPNEVLDVFPKAQERTEITPFGHRKVRIPDNRRLFEEMAITGRVVSRFQAVRGREVYGVQFVDIDGYQREEIARFIHAVQLSKMRA